MKFLDLQKKMLEDLKREDLPKYEMEYIVAVVKYIDSEMGKNNDNLGMFEAVNKMHELVKKINNNATGVSTIDGIEDIRMKSYYEATKNIPSGSAGYLLRFFKNKPYVDNYISIISQYGGLYKYVCTTYGFGALIDDEYGEDEEVTVKR